MMSPTTTTMSKRGPQAGRQCPGDRGKVPWEALEANMPMKTLKIAEPWSRKDHGDPEEALWEASAA